MKMKSHWKKTTVWIAMIAILPALLWFSGHADAKGEKRSHGHGDHWDAPPEAAKRQNPIVRSAESIEQGKQLFQKFCAVCHGAEGKGDGPAANGLNPKPSDLTGEDHSDGEVAWKIETGRGPMPSWKKTLSQEEIWHLTHYVQSL
jgi:mono/diheme cytochrome c family protein